MGCGSQPHANMYFISFMVIVSFVFLQLFIAIILESFNTIRPNNYFHDPLTAPGHFLLGNNISVRQKFDQKRNSVPC